MKSSVLAGVWLTVCLFVGVAHAAEVRLPFVADALASIAASSA